MSNFPISTNLLILRIVVFLSCILVGFLTCLSFQWRYTGNKRGIAFWYRERVMGTIFTKKPFPRSLQFSSREKHLTFFSWDDPAPSQIHEDQKEGSTEKCRSWPVTRRAAGLQCSPAPHCPHWVDAHKDCSQEEGCVCKPEAPEWTSWIRGSYGPRVPLCWYSWCPNRQPGHWKRTLCQMKAGKSGLIKINKTPRV